MLKKNYLLPEAGTGCPAMHSRSTWSFSVASLILLAADESLTCVLRQIFCQIFWYLTLDIAVPIEILTFKPLSRLLRRPAFVFIWRGVVECWQHGPKKSFHPQSI